ncbi:MAG TPA: tail fiber domain-containing protein, partial [Longimicrobiaceae bacterium]|nr:tail fiber domain-containing protein [Longimicrobiaceae bacterium]
SPVGAADTYLKSTGTGLTWGTPSGLLPSGTLANAPLLHSGTTGRDGDWANYSLPSVAAPYVAGDPAQVLRLTGANQVSFGALSASDVGALSKADADTYYRPAGGSIAVADISGTLPTSKGGTGTASLAGGQAVITNPDGSALTTPSGAADGRALLWRSTGPRWEAISGVVGSGTVDHPLLGSGSPGGTYAPYALPHLGAPEAGWVLRSTGSTGTEWHQLTAADLGALTQEQGDARYPLGGGYQLNQSLTTTDNPTFAQLTLTAQLVGGIGAITTAGVADWSDASNARSGSGYTLLSGTAANGFGDASLYHAFSFEYGAKTGAGTLTQLAVPYGNHTGPIRYRGRYTGTWTGWVTIANESWVAAGYSPLGHTHGWGDIGGGVALPVSMGGTGVDTLPAGVLVGGVGGETLTAPAAPSGSGPFYLDYNGGLTPKWTHLDIPNLSDAFKPYGPLGTVLTSNGPGGNPTWSVAPVTSVAGKTGAVSLTAADVGAAPTSHTHAWSDITSGVPVYATRWPTTSEIGAVSVNPSTSSWDLAVSDAHFVSGNGGTGPNGLTSYMGIYMPLSGSSGYAVEFAGRNDDFRVRTQEASAWTPWRALYHTGNFDPSAYLARNGGTMVGNIDFGSSYFITRAGVNHIRFLLGGTTFYQPVTFNNTVTATTFYKSSSRALKEDFRPLGFNPSAALDALSPLRFRYRGEAWEDVGFIAEDTDPLFLSPEGLQVDVARVATVLVADAQATHRRIEALEAELATLRAGLH